MLFSHYFQGMKINGVWTELNSQCITKKVDSLSGASHELRQLKPETYYKIELQAHNAIGLSDPAKILLKTPIGESNESYGTYVYRAGYTASDSSVVPKIHSLLFCFLCSLPLFFKIFTMISVCP